MALISANCNKFYKIRPCNLADIIYVLGYAIGESNVLIHIKRMRRILSIAASRGNDVMILGAFGCGAFKNPPEVVARAMKKVVQEFRNYFEVIEFAVYCSPKDEQNYTTFKRILGDG